MEKFFFFFLFLQRIRKGGLMLGSSLTTQFDSEIAGSECGKSSEQQRSEQRKREKKPFLICNLEARRGLQTRIAHLSRRNWWIEMRITPQEMVCCVFRLLLRDPLLLLHPFQHLFQMWSSHLSNVVLVQLGMRILCRRVHIICQLLF